MRSFSTYQILRNGSILFEYDLEKGFTNKYKEVISLSREEALRLGHDYVGTEHLILGIIREGEGFAVRILNQLKVPSDQIRTAIEQATKGSVTNTVKQLGKIPLTRQSEESIRASQLEAKHFGSEFIGTEHLLLAILKDERALATQILEKFSITYRTVKFVFKSEFGNKQFKEGTPQSKTPQSTFDDTQKVYESLNIAENERVSKLRVEINAVRAEKERVVALNRYEEAAQLRDKEKKLLANIEEERKKQISVYYYELALRVQETINEYHSKINDFAIHLRQFKNSIHSGKEVDVIKKQVTSIKSLQSSIHGTYDEFKTKYSSLREFNQKLTHNIFQKEKYHFTKLENVNPNFSELKIFRGLLDNWMQEQTKKGIDPFEDEKKIEAIEGCKIFIIDSNIWINPGISRELETLKLFLKVRSSIIRIPSEILEEIEKNIRKNSNNKKEVQKFRTAKSRLESFSSVGLLQLTGEISPDLDRKAYADPILLTLLESELKRQKAIAFISNDFHILIKAREQIRRSKKKGIGLNLDEFKDLMNKIAP